MASKKTFKPAREEFESRDRKRDRAGWKAARQDARRAKGKRRDFEAGWK